MSFLSSKFGQIQDYLRRKLYSGTKLQLITSGNTRKFPLSNLKRFVLPTTTEYEFGSYPGSVITTDVNVGSKFIPTDLLPPLNDNLVINLNSQKYGVLESANSSVTLFKTLNEKVVNGQPFFYDSYSVDTDGNYEDGFKQLLVNSILPVIPGDQWFVPTPAGSVKPAIVLTAKKTLNPLQWDVILDRPILVRIPKMKRGDRILTRVIQNTFPISAPVYFLREQKNGNYFCSFSNTNTHSTIEVQPLQILSIERIVSNNWVYVYQRDKYVDNIIQNKDPIYAQASAALYWDSIPLNIGPCVVNLPTVTHLQKSNASVVNCVQTLSGTRIVRNYLTKTSRFKISTGTIHAQSWLNAQILEGKFDYLPGLAHFIPTPQAIAKLTFLDELSGTDIIKWTASVQTEEIGYITFLFKNRRQRFDLVKGLNPIVIEVPQENFSWVEVSSNVSCYLGGLNSTDQVSHLNLALHVFKSEKLGSHIFGRPSIHSIIKDPSLTWAKVGTCGVNRGYTLTPGDGDYKILQM